MKRLLSFILLLVISGLLLYSCETPQNPVAVSSTSNVQTLAKKTTTYISIQDGILKYPASYYLAGQLLKTGFDPYGYNYQAHIFKGYYANVYLDGYNYPPYNGNDDEYLQENPGVVSQWYWSYRHIQILMKWNNAWLSNKDYDGDGKLDRHPGFPSYIGSGAWVTNHMSGEDGSGHWTYFVKIVAVPADANLDGGIWFTANGKEIGPSIWGDFATIQEVESGSGATYVSPAGPGLGKWKK